MQPFSGNQRPDLLRALMNMSLVLRLPRKMHVSRSSSNVPRLPSFLGNARKPSRFSHFWQGAQSLAPATQNDIWTSKSVPYPSVFCTLTSRCASRHNSLHFFHIATSKSGPRLVCFVHRDFEMCFAPQRRALFRHRNFKVPRSWSVLYILTWKCASRHNGVHFFDIATSKSGPSMVCFVHFDLDMCFAPQRCATFSTSQLFKSAPKLRRFVYFDLEMCFAPQRRATFHVSSDHMFPRPPLQRAYFSALRSHEPLGKQSVSRLFYFFAHLHLLSSDSFSSLIFSLLLFSFLTLLTSAFPSAHIVGSLTSKLPSLKININIISHIV